MGRPWTEGEIRKPICREHLNEVYQKRVLGSVLKTVRNGLNGLTNDADNHCAHFVNHVLSLDFGYTCGMATGKKKASANIRVHETFARCLRVGKWSDLKRNKITMCFAFITHSDSVNLGKKSMTNRPKKHIGIYFNDNIWHYSNKRDKVVKQKPAEFSKHYKDKNSQFSMFYGTFPMDATPVEVS